MAGNSPLSSCIQLGSSLRLRAKQSHLFLSLIWLFPLLLCACTPHLDLDPEDYERQLVVECYLMEGERARVIVHESVAYLSLDSLPVVSGARVQLVHNGDTLEGKFEPPAFYYTDDPIVRDEFPWYLRVEDPYTGRVVTGETRFLPIVPIDSSYFDIDVRGKFRMLMDFYDPLGQSNYYRMTAVSQRDNNQGLNILSF